MLSGDWGQGDLGRTYFQQAIGTGVSLPENRKCEKAVASPLELLREENRSRSALRVALTALISSREIERLKSSSCGDFVEDATLDFPPLQEHRELRGFIPLNSVYEVSCGQWNVLDFLMIGVIISLLSLLTC